MEKQKALKPKHKKIIPLNMDAAFFFERAVQSMDRFHYDKALKYFRRAVEYEPNNPVHHCNMAGILSEMGQFSDSNAVLQEVLDRIDPKMTECHFYMANNYANMEQFEAAESALVRYLELDANGHYLDEAEDMMEFLSQELQRPTPLRGIKAREPVFEHDRARKLLEEGKFTEAVQVLEKLAHKHSDFIAVRNNLALAYYYMGRFDKAMEAVLAVLEQEPGNLHALCNLTIFEHHAGRMDRVDELKAVLKPIVPYQAEQVFKIATTMGILGEHGLAHSHFRRLIRTGELPPEPSLYHYTAVAACNIGRYTEAERLWSTARELDPQSDVPVFYLNELPRLREEGPAAIDLHYHYHMPFEEQLRLLKGSNGEIPEPFRKDPLLRSSLFWSLRHGDHDTKLHVIQALSWFADREVEHALKELLVEPDESYDLKKVVVFVLDAMGVKPPYELWVDGKRKVIESPVLAGGLPRWEPEWQKVAECAILEMRKRYDLIQQHDMQTLWVEFLTRSYPNIPKLTKPDGWAAALEYLTAKMHRRTISYEDLSRRYNSSATTIRKHVKQIDQVCGIREKMQQIFPFLDCE